MLKFYRTTVRHGCGDYIDKISNLRERVYTQELEDIYPRDEKLQINR